MLEETVAALRRWAAIEEATFALLGGWVRSTPEPGPKLLFAEQSHHHAWHAELWRERGPVVPGMAVPAPLGIDAFFAAAGDLVATPERLVAAFLVLGRRMVAEYRAALGAASAITDGPMARGLFLVLADAERDLAAGEDLLRGDGSEGPDAHQAVRAELEAAWPGPGRPGAR